MTTRGLAEFSGCAVVLAVACTGRTDVFDQGFAGAGGSADATGRQTAAELPPRIPAPRPPPVDGAPEAVGRPVTLAVKSFLLGEVGWDGQLGPDAWTTYSFNLDGLVSTVESTNHCAVGGLLYQADGPGGLDNAFAGHFSWVLHNFSASLGISGQTNQAVADGTRTLLIRIENVAASGPESGVTAAGLLGGARAGPANFDGTDVWPVRAESLVGDDVNAARASYRGYIADDVFVSAESTTQPVELTLRGYRVPLTVHRASLSVDLRSIRAGGRTAYGVLTGALDVNQTTEVLRQLAFEAFRTCNDYAVRMVVENVAGYRDIVVDLSNGDPGVQCNAVSVGIGFVAVEASLGEVVPPEPPRDPCASGEPVESDGALAGTCDAIPPYELAVTCGVFDRAPPVYGTSRASSPGCSPYRPRGPVCPGRWVGESEYNRQRIQCFCHDECNAGSNGRCYVYGYGCSYDECFTDDDCGPSQLCDCNGGADGNHRCLPSNCRTDSDCPGGYGCSPTVGKECSNLSGVVGFYCHTELDDCRADGDCAGLCVYDDNASRWVCGGSSCTAPG